MRAKVLFVCIHNSGRSQIAEAWCNHLSDGELEAKSAGFEPRALNPLAVRAMEEVGIDIRDHNADSVFAFFKEGRRFHYIITVCDEGSAQKCPIFPGVTHRIHWSFPDPAALQGSEDEKMAQIRTIRDDIKRHVEDFIALVMAGKIKENAPQDWRFDT